MTRVNNICRGTRPGSSANSAPQERRNTISPASPAETNLRTLAAIIKARWICEQALGSEPISAKRMSGASARSKRSARSCASTAATRSGCWASSSAESPMQCPRRRRLRQDDLHQADPDPRAGRAGWHGAPPRFSVSPALLGMRSPWAYSHRRLHCSETRSPASCAAEPAPPRRDVGRLSRSTGMKQQTLLQRRQRQDVFDLRICALQPFDLRLRERHQRQITGDAAARARCCRRPNRRRQLWRRIRVHRCLGKPTRRRKILKPRQDSTDELENGPTFGRS